MQKDRSLLQDRDAPRRRWHYLPLPPAGELQQLVTILGVSERVATILLQRGLRDFATARDFFNPSLSNLYDPMRMKGMSKAVARVAQALNKKEKICIYGDYDVDGVTSVALLYRALGSLGANVSYYFPDRHQEGYGLSKQGVAFCAKEGIDVLITVDCGIRAVALVTEAKDHGVDVIICDHHEPGEMLPPAFAILDPKQKDCTYPGKELSGCGVAFKLLQGLQQQGLLGVETLYGYLDLVAVSIAADIVPLVGENRILAFHGMAQLEKHPCLGLEVLKRQAKRDHFNTISSIVFGLAPRINAAGRVRHAERAFRLLSTSDEEEAAQWAKLLEKDNDERKEHGARVLQEALTLIEEDASYGEKCTTVLFKPGWHKGVLGIVAARCVEHYYRPTIILTQQGDYATGSVRSVWGYNVYKALQQCGDLLARYGGHAYAAGVTLPLDHVKAFQGRFDEVVRSNITEALLTPTEFIDMKIHLRHLSKGFYNVLKRMRPFGPGNRQPVFATGPIRVQQYEVYQEKHLGLYIKQEGDSRTWRAIGFNMVDKLALFKNNLPVEIAYTLQENSYQGNVGYELFLKDIRPCV